MTSVWNCYEYGHADPDNTGQCIYCTHILDESLPRPCWSGCTYCKLYTPHTLHTPRRQA